MGFYIVEWSRVEGNVVCIERSNRFLGKSWFKL